MSKVIRIEDESFEYLKTLNNSPNNAIKVMKSKIEEKDGKIEKQIEKFEKEQKEIIQILRLLLKATFDYQALIKEKLITVPATLTAKNEPLNSIETY